MPGFTEISAAQLSRLIGTPDAPVLLDLRTAEDITSDPFTIPTAQRLAHTDLATRSAEFAGRRVVTICQRGLKLSIGGAALLRARGITAESLAEGTLGWAAAGLPRTAIDRLPAGHLWVTRHRPKIDRIACPWLIRRFIDPGAEFLFVAPGEVGAVADRFGAIPFDIDGVFHSHDGPLCTFDRILDHYGLRTDALDRLALVVRGADTDRHDLHPAAAGLLALSVGLSRQYRDDQAQLAAGMMVYDAFYRWARDGFDESHDWQPEARP